MKKDNILNEAIVVDVNSIPEGINFEEWLYLAKTTGVCIIDSTKGIVPFMLNSRKKLTFDIKDLKDEENKQ